MAAGIVLKEQILHRAVLESLDARGEKGAERGLIREEVACPALQRSGSGERMEGLK